VNDLDAEANLLGALALVVNDRTVDAIAATGLSLSAAAALSALHQFLDGPNIDRLRRVLGLTPSGAVRLVDRLVEAGYVVRGPAEDKRAIAVSLTPKGRRAAARVEAARASVLSGAVAGLSGTERDVLHALLGKLIAPFVRANIDRGSGGGWICRLCDLAACGRDAGRCPTANTAAGYIGQS
jgi:MarR family transcriptional repressor of emrRAB